MSLQVLMLTLLTVTFSACAQLALKLGVSRAPFAGSLDRGLVDSALAAATTPLIWLGLAIYALSVAMWLGVLSKVDLSVAYPFVGVSFLLTMYFGAAFLGESLSPLRMTGTVLIALGCVFVGRSA